ncbi:hypothetical protein K470DRAFT_254211 [Piedraia hortae CBS 480.64]|uniref:Uncharacterized protein n=1 Tax=Piedraia hortae CBS 480.64 TaxID=1314780 RepID=A0A6A7CAP4_9PEZI|nr:hypothetical protein K470DRAFT_254211 [Piedraia hortae CBS 480.64]
MDLLDPPWHENHVEPLNITKSKSGRHENRNNHVIIYQNLDGLWGNQRRSGRSRRDEHAHEQQGSQRRAQGQPKIHREGGRRRRHHKHNSKMRTIIITIGQTFMVSVFVAILVKLSLVDSQALIEKVLYKAMLWHFMEIWKRIWGSSWAAIGQKILVHFC